MPVHALKIVAFSQEAGPKNIEDGFLLPAHEGAINATAVAEVVRQMVPLAACSHSVDHAVEGQSLPAALAACFGRRVVNRKHLCDEFPKRIGDIPDCWQGFFVSIFQLRLRLSTWFTW